MENGMHEDTVRQRIFLAAVDVFAKNGFDQATTDEIAKKANIAKGTIYYHFKSKEALFFALIDDGIGKFSGELRKQTEGIRDPKEKLRMVIDVQLSFFTAYRNFCRVLFSELWRLESHWKKDVKFLQERYMSVIHEIIDEGKASGAFNASIDTEAATIAIFGLIAMTSLNWTVFAPDVARDTMLHSMDTILLHGMTTS